MRFRSKSSGEEVLAIQWVATDNREIVAKFLRRPYVPQPTLEFHMSEFESVSLRPGDWVVCSLSCTIGSPYYVSSDHQFRKNFEPCVERDASPALIENQKLLEEGST
jgi:hypothetical protein